jgi:hypothetical protein
MKRYFVIFCLILGYINMPAQNSTSMSNPLVYKELESIPNEIEQNALLEGARFLCLNDAPYAGQEYGPFFVPKEDDPIMWVRLNLIFIQKDDGTGNFQEANEEHQDLLDLMMQIMNENIINSLIWPGIGDCFSGTDEEMIHDMRIRFIDHRYYVRNSAIWDNNLAKNSINLCPDRPNWYLNEVDDSLNNIIHDTLKAINVYFTEDSSVYHRCWVLQDTSDTTSLHECVKRACSEFPYEKNLNASSRVHMPCGYSKFWWMKHIVPQLASQNYLQWDYQGRLNCAGSLASGLIHELGHSFDLKHPNQSGNQYPDTSCVFTIMSPSGESPRNFLPPNEIGVMYFKTMTTNLQQFVPTNTYLGTKTLDTILTLPQMRLFYSLEIDNNGFVTLPCDITFSAQCDINIGNGGILIVDDATLQSVQNEWGGIIVQSGGQLILSNTTIGDYNIIVKSGGSLVIRNDLTITGEHHILIEDGGYLCVNTDASINLIDGFSSIIISPNAFLGCPSCNENCTLMYDELINTGNGRFITYYGTDYVQDTIITSNYMATGNNVMVGYDVTNTKPVGSVIVQDGGNLRIMANDVILTRDVEIKQGGTLRISQ